MQLSRDAYGKGSFSNSDDSEPNNPNFNLAFNGIYYLLHSYAILTAVLDTAECLFINFLQKHLCGRNPLPVTEDPKDCVFDRWLVGWHPSGLADVIESVISFPYPESHQLISARSWKGNHPLTLFTSEMLVYFGVLVIDKTIDDQVIYTQDSEISTFLTQ